MPISAAQLDALKRFIHPADIYVDCAPPAVFTAIALTAGVPPKLGGGSAVTVGATSGATTFNYKPTIEGIDIEQTPGKVAPRIKEESLEVKFKCAEPTGDRLALALGSGATRETTAASGATPGTDVFYVGGNLEVTTQCITLVAKIGSFVYMATTVTLYAWVCIYQACSSEGLGIEWKRAENQMIEVTIMGWADPTRDEGDNLVQVGQLTGP